MEAEKEIAHWRAKLRDGSVEPDEPLFVLRARDCLAANVVRQWIFAANLAGVPQSTLREASELAEKMDQWPIKRVPKQPLSQYERCVDCPVSGCGGRQPCLGVE